MVGRIDAHLFFAANSVIPSRPPRWRYIIRNVYAASVGKAFYTRPWGWWSLGAAGGGSLRRTVSHRARGSTGLSNSLESETPKLTRDIVLIEPRPSEFPRRVGAAMGSLRLLNAIRWVAKIVPALR